MVYRLIRRDQLVAAGNCVLTVIWHLLSDPDEQFLDLGPDYYDSKINKRRRERDLVRQLEHLTGRKVTLTDAA